MEGCLLGDGRYWRHRRVGITHVHGLDEMTPQEKRDAIEELIKSTGWTVLKQEIQNSILQAAYQLSDNAGMPLEEVHFRRGSMWAARKFLELPDAVSAIMQNDLLLDAANKAQHDNPATAGRS